MDCSCDGTTPWGQREKRRRSPGGLRHGAPAKRELGGWSDRESQRRAPPGPCPEFQDGLQSAHSGIQWIRLAAHRAAAAGRCALRRPVHLAQQIAVMIQQPACKRMVPAAKRRVKTPHVNNRPQNTKAPQLTPRDWQLMTATARDGDRSKPDIPMTAAAPARGTRGRRARAVTSAATAPGPRGYFLPYFSRTPATTCSVRR